MILNIRKKFIGEDFDYEKENNQTEYFKYVGSASYAYGNAAYGMFIW